MAGRTGRLKVRRAVLHDRISFQSEEHVRHPDGGRRTFARTLGEHTALDQWVAAEREQGSRKHHRLRMHKDHSGTIPASDVDGLTRIIVGACVGGLIVLGLLMFARMRSEVLLALGGGAAATAITVAAALAAVSVLANIMVISVHALDGSEETDRLGALAAALSRSQVRADRMHRQAARLDHVVALRVLKAERGAAGGISRAARPFALADQTIDNARAIHQGAGTLSENTDDPNGQPGAAGYRQPAAIPRMDERPLRHALIEASSPLPSETG